MNTIGNLITRRAFLAVSLLSLTLCSCTDSSNTSTSQPSIVNATKSPISEAESQAAFNRARDNEFEDGAKQIAMNKLEAKRRINYWISKGSRDRRVVLEMVLQEMKGRLGFTDLSAVMDEVWPVKSP
jgi:Fe-S cluster assembly ATPase SufC